jgi:hypothetical protein
MPATGGSKKPSFLGEGFESPLGVSTIDGECGRTQSRAKKKKPSENKAGETCRYHVLVPLSIFWEGTAVDKPVPGHPVAASKYFTTFL